MAITFVDSAAAPSFNETLTLTAPAGVQDGDTGILFFFASAPLTTFAIPSGWTQVGNTAHSDTDGGGLESRCYRGSLTAAAAGSSIAITVDAAIVCAALMLVYRGVDGTNPVADFDVTTEKTQSAMRTTPTVTVPNDGTLIEALCDRVSSNTAGWTVPSPMTSRATQQDVNNLLAAVAADNLSASGTAGGHDYTKSMSAPRYAAWSLALTPVASAPTTQKLVVRRATSGTWK